MSTLAVSPKALIGVRQTLRASLYWKTNEEDTPLCIFDSFAEPHQTVFNTNVETWHRQVDNFIQLAYIFNDEEMEHAKYAKAYAEPIEWQHIFHLLDKCDGGRRFSVYQFLTTLRFIRYNTTAKGWMDEMTYQNWSRREEYEKFHKTLARMISAVACDICSRLPQMKQTEWCL